MIDHAHWNKRYLPNDIMSPTSNYYSIISAFTLEYLDLTHPNYLTNQQKIKHNFYQDKFYKDDYLYYKCPSNAKSEVPFFCSKWEIENDPFSCSEDYNMKMGCSQSYNSSTLCGEKLVTNDSLKICSDSH